jgi:hypothetical protein
MSETNNPDGHTRRGFMRRVGATGVTLAGAGYIGSETNLMTQRADAIACGGICIGVGIAGAGAAAGWLLRDTETIGKDSPPSGLTASALKNDIINQVKARKSNNASTFVDNKNIIQGGKQVAYSQGKLAAIKAINNGKTESDTLADATAAVNAHTSTILKNFLKSWNEGVQEHREMIDACAAHPNVDVSSDTGFITYNQVDIRLVINKGGSVSETLPDGSTFSVLECRGDSNSTRTNTPLNGFEEGNAANNGGPIVDDGNGGSLLYLRTKDWHPLYNEITSMASTVESGIGTWVSNVYSQVQSGDLDPGQLLSPAELSQLSSSEEYNLNQAQADLLALNIPTDLERTATVSLSQTSGSSTLKGTLGATSSVTINAGDTIDPSTTTEDYYLTYDVSQAKGAWTSYNSGIDGGILTLTEKPFENVQYSVSTADDETATFGSGAASENSNGNYEVDLSAQLNTQITTAQTISYESTVSQTKYITILLDETFTVKSFVDSSGSDVSSVDYTAPAQAESDSNYITAQEWEDREQKYKNLIDKYKEETSSGGGGGGGLLTGALPSLPGLSVRDSVIAVVGGLIGLRFLGD